MTKTLRLYYKYQSVDVVLGKCPLLRHKHTVCVHCCFWKLKCAVLEQGLHFLRNMQRTAQCRISLFPQQLFKAQRYGSFAIFWPVTFPNAR